MCLTSLVLTPVAAQLRNQRRVTAIQLGAASQGSRVTVVSDLALSDYEAFRRGDRFYLKLPLADLASLAPHFRADGFEDVQVQKTGDGLIVSFKLQPGATARVEQRGNLLEVVFTAANRNASNSSSSKPGIPGSENATRGRDGAGPTPAAGTSASRERFVSARPGSEPGGRWPRNPPSQTKPQTDVSKNSNLTGNKNANETGNKKPTPIIAAATSPSPAWSPTAVPSPGSATGYQPVMNASPAVSASPQAVAGSFNPLGSGNSSNFQSVRHWISSNRLATLLGALILLSLIAYLVMAIRRRPENGDRARLAKTPKVQPRYSADELNEPGGSVDKQPSRESISKTPISKAAVADPPVANDPRILTKPSTVTPAIASGEHDEGEKDREVFEL